MNYKMRRTYGSKKGDLFSKRGIDALDEKETIFEAFYIQNIKQTKRELCISTNHNISKKPKTRRRKYVKRIVTDIEPQIAESVATMAISTYLTPDKSIHVKRDDLFDQLLNSVETPKRRTEPISKNNSIDKSQHDSGLHFKKKSLRGQTRSQKQIKQIFNNSSEDSDKENGKDKSLNSTSNVTDFRQHSLILKPMTKDSKQLDTSIYNILNNGSIIKYFKDNLKPKITKSPLNRHFIKHRLTENLSTPEKGTLPITSTPLARKHDRKSIYNLSPIFLNVNKDLICGGSENKQFNEITQQCLKEPADVGPDNSLGSGLFHNKEFDNECVENRLLHDTSECKSVESSIKNNSSLNRTKNFAIVPEIKLNNNKSIITEKEIDTTAKLQFADFTKSTSLDQSCDKSGRSLKSETGFLPETTKYYITCHHTSFEPLGLEYPNLPEHSKNYTSVISLNAEVNDYLNQSKQSPCISHGVKESIVNKSLDKNSSRVSLYNTCYNLDFSSNSCNKDSHDIQPKVYITRLNDSTFQRYYDEMPTYTSSDEPSINSDFDEFSMEKNVSVNSNDLVSSATFSNSNKANSRLTLVVLKDDSITGKDEFQTYLAKHIDSEADDIKTESCNFTSENDSFYDQDYLQDDSNCSDHEIEEGEYGRFVTTRKRNELTNNSVVLDSSNLFFNSFNYDNTMINAENKVIKDDIQTDKINSLDFIENNIYEDKEIIEARDIIKDAENANNTGCMNTLKKSVHNSPPHELVENHKEIKKQPIVLQPGKKWERSLSIYKRITALHDQFDLSVVNETSKGRNYRQSVIHTMEIQDFNKSSINFHHNESFDSHLTTFVSKPSRSTVRIAKESNNTRLSINSTSTYEELQEFLSEDCDDTLIDLSKLSLTDAEHEVTVLEKIEDTSVRLPSALDYVLRRCNQTELILFDECYPDTVLKNCRKIGEGVYGEVFLWRSGDGRVRVMKVVPVGGDTRVNGEPQKDFAEIISEIVIAMELSALRAPIAVIDQHFDEGKEIDTLDLHTIENATDAFNEVLAVRCVYGTYPSRLLDLWDLYDECKGSDNDNPAVLPPDQRYIVLELANAGQDLECYIFNNAEQAYSLLVQTAYALAVAEEAYQFEHRDLHWGNVLIAPTDQKYGTFVLRGRIHRVARCGVQASIIDYSLSRVSLPLGSGPGAEHVALYNDLATDESLFSAFGDYQFDVYRHMKEKLGNEWKNFEPYTNILWLHYMVDKMITSVHYKRTNTKIHKNYIAKLKGVKDRILDYGSAVQFVLTDNEFSMLTN